jgi:hypothetical protein
MMQTPRSVFVAALGELRMIRDQLVPGRAVPEQVEALTERAATVLSTARAALRRAATNLDVLAETATAASPAEGGRPS